LKGIAVYACADVNGTTRLNVLVLEEQTGLVTGTQDELLEVEWLNELKPKYPPAPTITMTTIMITAAVMVERPREPRQRLVFSCTSLSSPIGFTQRSGLPEAGRENP
jgi:hypothetical protein